MVALRAITDETNCVDLSFDAANLTMCLHLTNCVEAASRKRLARSTRHIERHKRRINDSASVKSVQNSSGIELLFFLQKERACRLFCGGEIMCRTMSPRPLNRQMSIRVLLHLQMIVFEVSCKT